MPVEMIPVRYITDEAMNALKATGVCEEVSAAIAANPEGSDAWLDRFTEGIENLWVQKRFQMQKIRLLSPGEDGHPTEFENAIQLYLALKDLPRYVVCDERFWLWANLTWGYRYAAKEIVPMKPSTFLNHWTFSQGKRRGLFFGVLSRLFLYVDLTWKSGDPVESQEVTKFALENFTRIRELTWRTNSNNRNLVRGVLLGEMDFIRERAGRERTTLYSDLAKRLSQILAVRFSDSMSEEDFRTLSLDLLRELSGS